MGKYSEDAKQLLRLVGGKENIAAVSHCMTRMRFALVDPEKADVPVHRVGVPHKGRAPHRVQQGLPGENPVLFSSR